MNNTNDNLFKEYKSKYNDCSNYLEQGIELLRKLLDRNFESYIIGCAVCDYYLIRPIKQITILTPATVDELQQIFPSLTINNGIPSLVEKTGTFYFETNNNDNKKIVSKAANKYYNKKLSSYLEKKPFTISALSLSPALKIIDIAIVRAFLDCQWAINEYEKETKTRSTPVNLINRVSFNAVNSQTKTLKVSEESF